MDTTDAVALFAALDISLFSIILLVGLALLLSSYVKIVTVLSIVRIGFGVQSLPGVIITGGLALCLAFFVMYPTIWKSLEAMQTAQQASSGGADIVRAKSISAGLLEWKEFLKSQVHEDVHNRFMNLRGEAAEAQNKNSWQTIVPAFYVSELKEAFATALSLFLPFLILDICVAVLLAALGVQSLDTHVVALPLKLLLFVMLDGWTLIGANLAASYGGS